jgi:hypothetical protein
MASKNKNDQVNHPKHYTSDPSGIECIDVTRHRNFNIGNAIKYLWRAGLKEDKDRKLIDKQVEDLNKAVWYLVDEIHRLGGRCTVKTDSINTCLPIDNESIIDAVMNYSKVVDGTCKTLLGVGGNNDKCRGILCRTIEDHIDYWYRVQKDGGQTKLDM